MSEHVIAHEAAGPIKRSRSVMNQGGGNWFSAVPGEALQIRVRGTEVEGRFTIIESIVEPGIAVPLHAHREQEIFHVLEGVVTFEVDGRRFEATPGAILVVPEGVPHRWANFDVVPTRMMVMLAPGGIEGFFEELSVAGLQALPEITVRYGTIVLGPPLER